SILFIFVIITSLSKAFLYREIFCEKYTGNEKLDGKTVVITGANTGLGKEAAIQFASRGARVVMACRDLDKCHKARVDVVLRTGNKQVKCSQLDLASLKSINEFVDRFKQKEKNIHILINNAGVMRCPKTLTEDGFEMQIGVNHFGHFLLTNLLIDLLKASKPSRIVNVASRAHYRGTINFDDINSDKSYSESKAYNQSKLANVLFTRELAKKLKGSGVFVYAADPGIVNTEIGRHMGYYKSYFSSLFAKPFLWLFLRSPKQGVQTILYCALSEQLASEEFSGKYFS
ncbi:dehydrogenase-like protein, partial [Dinothrombium tinctorium]